MKHQTPESMKFKKFARRLNLEDYEAAGLLEMLWITTQKNTPCGDIGKFDNEEIAIALGWKKDADELVEAMVATGWLDACATHRLVVHDWEEHCPGWVKRQLARHKRSFVTASSLLTVTDDAQEATPNLTKPNLTKPNTIKRASPAVVVEQGFEEFWSAYPPARKRDKERARKAYAAAVRAIRGRDGPGGQNPHEWLTERARAYAASPLGRGKFSKMPSSWLNGGAYDDEPSAWQDQTTMDRGSVSAVEAILSRRNEDATESAQLSLGWVDDRGIRQISDATSATGLRARPGGSS